MARIKDYVDGVQELPTAADFNAIKDATWWSKGDGADVDAWAGRPGNGGLHRFGVAASVTKATGQVVYLDTQNDWRDRVLLVHWSTGFPSRLSAFSEGFSTGFGSATQANSGPAWPGMSDGVSFASSSDGSQLMITGPGQALGHVTKPDFGIQLEAGLFLYVLTTGELVIGGNASLQRDTIGVVLSIQACDQLAIETTPATLNDPTAVATNAISSGHLNTLQDGAMQGQFNEGDTDLDVETTPTSMPLGAKGFGVEPAIPQSWDIRKRIGEEGTTDLHRRQRTAGGSVRSYGEQVAAQFADMVIADGSIDWRDRHITIVGRYHTGNIQLFSGTKTDYNDPALGFHGTFYSHDGKPTGIQSDTRHGIDIITNLHIYVTDDGRLVVRNDSGTTYYLAVMIMATPQLGTRSERG